MKLTEFRYSVENFRGLAIIFVMLTHLSSLNASKIYLFIFADATAWFVFLSGYLLSHIEFANIFIFKKYINKKLKFVITPYLILSIPAVLAAIYTSHPRRLNLSNFEYILWALSVGGDVIIPMWFIPMIFLLFILSPVFYKLNSHLLPYITVFFLVISIFSNRPFGNLNPFLSLFHFLGFYLLGIYIHSIRTKIYELNYVSAIYIIIMGLILYIITLFKYLNYSDVKPNYIGFFNTIGDFNHILFGKLLLLISIFVFFEKFLNTKNELLSRLAQISFGLFFIHGFYMRIFGRFVAPLALKTQLITLIEFILVIPMSILTVYILKKTLKNRSKYVVGC